MSNKGLALLGCDALMLIGIIGMCASTSLVWLAVLAAGAIGLLGVITV